MAWTSKYRYYGNTVTSKLEGAHAMLKRYLYNSRGDLLTVMYNTKRYIDNFIQNYQAKLARTMMTPPNDINAKKLPFLRDDLNEIIVPYAIERVVKQWR